MSASKIEFSITWNGKKIARFHVDDLPWWLGTVIAIFPKGSLCICVARNYDEESRQIKKIMTANKFAYPTEE